MFTEKEPKIKKEKSGNCATGCAEWPKSGEKRGDARGRGLRREEKRSVSASAPWQDLKGEVRSPTEMAVGKEEWRPRDCGPKG